MALADEETALEALIRALSPVPIVAWLDKPRAFGGTFLLLSTLGESGNEGRDELRAVFDEGPRLYTAIGRRTFTLSIKCESFDQGRGKTAAAYLSKLRLRFAFQSSKAALVAANVGMVKIEPVRELPVFGDMRAVSVAVMDLHLRRVAIEADANTYGTIDKISGTKSLDGVETPFSAEIVFP